MFGVQRKPFSSTIPHFRLGIRYQFTFCQTSFVIIYHRIIYNILGSYTCTWRSFAVIRCMFRGICLHFCCHIKLSTHHTLSHIGVSCLCPCPCPCSCLSGLGAFAASLFIYIFLPAIWVLERVVFGGQGNAIAAEVGRSVGKKGRAFRGVGRKS